jgi:hypothetical protein
MNDGGTCVQSHGCTTIILCFWNLTLLVRVCFAEIGYRLALEQEKKMKSMDDEARSVPQTYDIDVVSALMRSQRPDLYTIPTHAPGPPGKLPLTSQMLREWSSGDLFGLTQNVGMGWTRPEC